MGFLTQMDDAQDVCEDFRDARDHMIAVYDREGVESAEFDAAYEAYVVALEEYEAVMSEMEAIRAEIAAI